VHNAGNYYFISTDSCGISHQASAVVSVFNLPTVGFSTIDTMGCVPYLVQFANTSNAQSYVWNFGDGVTSADISPLHTYTSAGIYDVSVTATSAQGCKNKLNIISLIHTELKPELNFAYSPDSALIDNSTEVIRFNAMVSGADTFWWECPDYNLLDTGLSFAVTMPDTGLHDVLLIGQSPIGCRDTLIRTIRVRGAFTLYVPNSFTPFNQDGLNDVFKPVGTNLDTSTFYCAIYDRWGVQLHEFTNPNQGWDGKIDGKWYGGMYNWIITCRDIKGVQYQFSGILHVIP
jgi:gliding motility-associated-like protein